MKFNINASPEFIESQYLLWRQVPENVSPDWHLFFEGFELGQVTPGIDAERMVEPDIESILKHAAVQSLIYRYRDIGHLLACTDPLNPCPTDHPLLNIAAFGLESSDLDRTFYTRTFMARKATLREILEVMQATYCRSIGVEFMHIQDPGERDWLKDRMEPMRNRPELSFEQKRAILRKLLQASLFETFLHHRFVGQKRFSLEGGEVVIPLLDRMFRKAASMGIEDIILGMAHRGRLNILANIFNKPLENIFAEFEDNIEFGFVGEGDVKYHKGYSTDLTLEDGGSLHLTMASNPSHLEAVDPVVEGKCRARQDHYGENGTARVLPVLIHGDAAFAGQGMVAETLNLSQLEGYGTGGTVHIVINNQIGFTTVPEDARSTPYATDMAKMLSIPIFHVHGENPEAVVHAANLALDYRQAFGRDVVVEVICYRRQGHNEGDEPYFTQPLMYEKIRTRPPVQTIYADQLRQEGMAEEEIDSLTSSIKEQLENALKGERGLADIVGFHGRWKGIERQYHHVDIVTGVDKKTLRILADRVTTLPDDFHPHQKIARFLEKRRSSVRSGKKIDWSTAETLAFATLLAEGVSIRMSGQDTRRGTFTQRHSTLFDIQDGSAYVPLTAAVNHGASVQVFDSMLSEAAVLGFEYGYSLETPHHLTIWEAQFGDFANSAQVIIDQFIISSETKWDRVSGLTLFLPHGFEGQGPEHSSARIERFLQLCAGNNIQVTSPSTPAQFFHLLRRQIKQPFRRPLIVFTPKALLRLPLCTSDLGEFIRGSFQEILPAGLEPEKTRTLLLCSGKIYFDLLAKMHNDEIADVAIVRVEQLYPLRDDLLRQALEPFISVPKIAWVQEEPANAGAWTFIRSHLAKILGRDPAYIGRDEAASPAVGSHRLHNQEQEAIISEALRP